MGEMRANERRSDFPVILAMNSSRHGDHSGGADRPRSTLEPRRNKWHRQGVRISDEELGLAGEHAVGQKVSRLGLRRHMYNAVNDAMEVRARVGPPACRLLQRGGIGMLSEIVLRPPGARLTLLGPHPAT
jgi:hypothetical protein